MEQGAGPQFQYAPPTLLPRFWRSCGEGVGGKWLGSLGTDPVNLGPIDPCSNLPLLPSRSLWLLLPLDAQRLLLKGLPSSSLRNPSERLQADQTQDMFLPFT